MSYSVSPTKKSKNNGSSYKNRKNRLLCFAPGSLPWREAARESNRSRVRALSMIFLSRWAYGLFGNADRHLLTSLVEHGVQVGAPYQRMGGHRRSRTSQHSPRHQPCRNSGYLRRFSPRRPRYDDVGCYHHAGPKPVAARHLVRYSRGDRELLDRDQLSGGEHPIDEDTRTHFQP